MKTLHIDFKKWQMPKEFKKYCITSKEESRASIQMDCRSFEAVLQILKDHDDAIMHAIILDLDKGRIWPIVLK